MTEKNKVDAQMCLALFMKDCNVLNIYTVIMNYSALFLHFSVIFFSILYINYFEISLLLVSLYETIPIKSWLNNRLCDNVFSLQIIQ